MDGQTFWWMQSRVVKLSMGSCSMSFSSSCSMVSGQQMKVYWGSFQLESSDSKLPLADPESQIFLSLRCDISHGRHNLRSQFDELLWLSPTYRTSPVEPSQTWPYPINFLWVVPSILLSLISLSLCSFSCQVAFWITSFKSFVSPFRVACLVNILYDHFQMPVPSLIFNKVTLIFHFRC